MTLEQVAAWDLVAALKSPLPAVKEALPLAETALAAARQAGARAAWGLDDPLPPSVTSDEPPAEHLERARAIVAQWSEAYDPGVVPVFTDEGRVVNYYHVQRAVAQAFELGKEEALLEQELRDEQLPQGRASDTVGSEVDRLRGLLRDASRHRHKALRERNAARELASVLEKREQEFRAMLEDEDPNMILALETVQRVLASVASQHPLPK